MLIVLIGLIILFCVVMLVHHFWGKHLRATRFFKNLDLSFRGMIIALALVIAIVSAVEVQNLIPKVPSDFNVGSDMETDESPTESQVGQTIADQTAVDQTVVVDQPSVADQTTAVEQTTATEQTVVASQGGSALAPSLDTTKKAVNPPTNAAVPATKVAPVATVPVTKPAEVITAAPVTKPTTTAAAVPQYADGVYSGSGFGFRGTIDVEVTISSGQISDVIVTDHQEDMKWYNRAYYEVVDRILAANSSKVDSVSGATYSSLGIIDGVYEALEKSKAAKK